MVGLEAIYIPVVKGYLDAYISRKKDERAAVVGLAVLDIQNMAEEKGVPAPLFPQKVCGILHHDWVIYNHRCRKWRPGSKITVLTRREQSLRRALLMVVLQVHGMFAKLFNTP
jgi:hypothetical protein